MSIKNLSDDQLNRLARERGLVDNECDDNSSQGSNPSPDEGARSNQRVVDRVFKWFVPWRATRFQ